MKKFKKEDVHPLAINVLKLKRYNYNFFNCEEVVFFEYIVVKGMAFKNRNEFYHSSETIRKETGIKKHSLKSIISRFEDLGIISTVIKGMPRVKHFIVHFPIIVNLLPQIYQSSENGKLSSKFSKHLSDFFLPLVENYLQKNNIKNRNKELLNEKEEYDSEGDSILSFFNDFLSDLKYKRKCTPKQIKFKDIDLFRCLKEYEMETVCDYIEKYFSEGFSPMLSKFFVFDKNSFNKLVYIEQKTVEEIEYVDNFVNELQRIYNSRISMHNDSKSEERGKSESKLVVTKRIKELIKVALETRSEIEITNAFKPYIDEILKDESPANKILPYFFSNNEGEYEIIDNYLEHYNLNYGYSKN